MATGTVILPVTGANVTSDFLTTGCALDPTDSGGKLLFDDTADESCLWTFRLPQNYSSAPVLKVQYAMVTATSGNIILNADIMAISDGDSADSDSASFDTVNASATTAVPATAGYLDEISITLTNADSMVANDLVHIRLTRDADNASDTASGDCEVLAVSLEYTTS